MEYEKAFQPIMEKGASENLVLAEDANLLIALNTLVEGSTLVGQYEMLSSDTFYYLNPEKPNPAIQPLKVNGEPLYITPQDRLNRPSDTREGRRAVELISEVRPVRIVEPSRPAGWGQTSYKSTGSGGWSR